MRVPVEIGCSTRTGITVAEGAGLRADYAYLDTAFDVIAISAESAASIGSDFARCGPVFQSAHESDGTPGDEFGARRVTNEGGLTSADYPLAAATADEIRSLPHPELPVRLQISEASEMPTIFDPAIPGLIEMCFALRGGWSFLDLCVERSPIASALLDHVQSIIVEHYRVLLAALPCAPSIVLYRDEWGSEVAPYFGAEEFGRLIWPRLKVIFSEIRRTCAAPIAVQLQGASRPSLPLLVDNGIELISIDCNARGMVAAGLRRELGRDVVLGGTADLWALGNCLSTGDIRGTATLACELAAAMPTIAAPANPLTDQAGIYNVARAAAFLRALTEDDLEQLSRLGPVRDVIERAACHLPKGFYVAGPKTMRLSGAGIGNRLERGVFIDAST